MVKMILISTRHTEAASSAAIVTNSILLPRQRWRHPDYHAHRLSYILQSHVTVTSSDSANNTTWWRQWWRHPRFVYQWRHQATPTLFPTYYPSQIQSGCRRLATRWHEQHTKKYTNNLNNTVTNNKENRAQSLSSLRSHLGVHAEMRLAASATNHGAWQLSSVSALWDNVDGW